MFSGIAALLASSGRKQPDGALANDEREIEREVAALLASVLDGLSTPTLVTSVDGEITHLNTPAAELYRVAASEAVGSSPADLHDGIGEPIVQEALDAGAAIEERETTLTVDGERIAVSRTVSLLYGDDGDCIGALQIDRDVTERREQAERTETLEAYQQARLDDLNAALTALAAGDLTIDLSTPEPEADFSELRESYEAFAAMNDQLTAAVASVRSVVGRLTDDAESLAGTSQTLSGSAEEVTSTIQQIDASTTEMANGSEQLADRTQRASASVDDLSAAIQQITASLQQIDARSDEAADIAAEGVVEVTDTVEQIRRATDASGGAIERIETLEANMERVEEIVGMIADIADQTNILALNANIEAARAGEAGEGFAVVANEVKSLSQETRQSAGEVADIVAELQAATGDVAEGIADANDEVRQGANAIEGVGERLETISDHVDETSHGVGEMAQAVEGQADDAEALGAAVEDLAALAEETTASIQQISAGVDEQADAMDAVAYTAEDLARLSDDLHDAVDRFRLAAEESADVDAEAARAAQERVDDAEGAEAGVAADDQRGRQRVKVGRSAAVGGDRQDTSDGNGPQQLTPDDF